MYLLKKVARKALSVVLGPLEARRAQQFSDLLDARQRQAGVAPEQKQRVDKGTQILLHLAYRRMLHEGQPLPHLDEVGFRAFSQFDEDGILLYIFTLIGVTHKTCVEICAGVGYECNTANLIINHGWDGLLFDGDAANVQAGRDFFAAHPDTFWQLPTLVQAWIDAETINDKITAYGFSGEIDLLSLDMDGIDFWVWKAIDSIQPRVVVLEFNDAIPADVSVAVPYAPDFVYSNDKPGWVGASLAAWVTLGRQKGYRLVGRNRNTLNAFFVRADLCPDVLPEVSAASCLGDRVTCDKVAARWQQMAEWDWVRI